MPHMSKKMTHVRLRLSAFYRHYWLAILSLIWRGGADAELISRRAAFMMADLLTIDSRATLPPTPDKQKATTTRALNAGARRAIYCGHMLFFWGAAAYGFMRPPMHYISSSISWKPPLPCYYFIGYEYFRLELYWYIEASMAKTASESRAIITYNKS